MSTDGDDSGAARTTGHREAGQDETVSASGEFDLRGWVLVGVIVLCFLVIPATIVARPPALPWEVAFLVLPLLPAFLLGAIAVWAALGRGQS